MTGRRRWTVLAVAWLVLASPLVVALVALAGQRWFPVLDLAMTELRVRDVGGPHTPLIGLPGRIGDFPEQGSHPGPMSFWALAPVYRLLGSTAFALQASAIALNIAAIGVSLAIAMRRGGLRWLVAVAVLLALLTRGYGIEPLVEPWNPYMPLLWWVAALLAMWAAIDGDLAMLPVAVVAGSMAAQTHVPYLGLVLGAGAFTTAVITWRAVRRPATRRRAAAWVAAAAAVGLVLWAPVLVDQVTHEPGNVTMLRHHFLDPPEEPVGLGTGARLTLLHLDVWSLLSGGNGASGSLVSASSDPAGSTVPGAVVVVVWLLSVGVAARRGWRDVLRLHALVAVGLVLVTYSLSRIFGKLWYYLMLSAWAVAGLALLAVAWTAVEEIRRRTTAGRRRAFERSLVIGGVAATLLSTLAFAASATSVEPPALRLSVTLAETIPATAAALERGVGSAEGRSGLYLVTWEDAFYIGSQGYGVVNELERRGYRVGVLDPWRVPVTRHRVLDPGDATARVHFATGYFIDEWRRRPDAFEVAYHDPRTPAQRREYERLYRRSEARLRAIGREDLLSDLRGNLFGATLDPDIPDDLREDMERLLELGLPGAAFITSTAP